MNPYTTKEGFNKMQDIAIICLAAATIGSSLLLGWLWCMASTGTVPGWLKRMHETANRGGSDLL